MIIGDLHLEGVTVAPAETQPPLPVDAYAMLALAVTGQRLQPITRRAAQKIQRRGRRETGRA